MALDIVKENAATSTMRRALADHQVRFAIRSVLALSTSGTKVCFMVKAEIFVRVAWYSQCRESAGTMMSN